MSLVFKSEPAQANAEKAEDEPPATPDPHAGVEVPPSAMHSTPLKQTRQIVKKQKFTHPEQKFAPPEPTKPQV